MQRRAAALAAGRPRAYAATATGPQRDRDREAARNARGLGLRDVELAVDSTDLGRRRATLRVRSVYGVRGVRGRFASARRITARRTGAGWRVVRESSPRERHPWELGRVQARRSEHFVVLAPRGLEIGALLDALEGGYARMGEVLDKPRLRRRYLVVVAGGAQAARCADPRASAASSRWRPSPTPRCRRSGSAQRVNAVVSQRLVVVWPSFSTLDAAGRQRVVTHELTHAALAGATSGRTPAWLVEGIALYVSEDRRIDEAAQLRVRGALPSLRALSRPDAIARLSGDAPGGGVRLRLGGGVLPGRALRPPPRPAPHEEPSTTRISPAAPAQRSRAAPCAACSASRCPGSTATCGDWVTSRAS